jgi:hypothetical protein
MVAAVLALSGCGGGEKPAPKGNESGGKAVTRSDQSGHATSGEATALKGTGHATLKGKVTFAGDPPPVKKVDMDNQKDKPYCEKGETNDPTWIVSPDKGVANVVVWLRPPADHYFDLAPDQREPAQKEVKVDQPYCAFEPHIIVLFPSYYDGASKTQKPTGQKFEVANSAPFSHNTNISSNDPTLNSGFNEIVPSNAKKPVDIKADKPRQFGKEALLSVKCNIHTWMTGYVWAFDHPFVAVTGKDGSYEIKNVPAGVELHAVAWHEPDQFILPEGSGNRQGQKLEPLKEGSTKELNFTVSKR